MQIYIFALQHNLTPFYAECGFADLLADTKDKIYFSV